MNVKVVGTTDDPVDDLAFHARLQRENFDVTVVPTFRPDKAGAIEDAVAYNAYIDRLAEVSGSGISTFSDLLAALDKRHAYFHEHGCRCSDHGFETLSGDLGGAAEIAATFAAVRCGKMTSPSQIAKFKAALLLEVCKMNHSRGWVQQLHFGIIRNARSRLFKALGPDAGVDCIGDYAFARPLASFLDALDATGQLAKTVLFNGNPKDNEMLACMAQAFQDGTVPGKIQLGPAWWFLDQKDGMVRHLNALSYFGLLSRFVGMTTDSRSLLSFPRHDYFRRIFCNLLGEEMERGDLPGDFGLIGAMVKDICFANAKRYFGIDVT
jgi:glucuronate isomerase